MISKDENWWRKISDPNLKNEIRQKLDKEKNRSIADYLLFHELYFTNMDDLYNLMKPNWKKFF